MRTLHKVGGHLFAVLGQAGVGVEGGELGRPFHSWQHLVVLFQLLLAAVVVVQTVLGHLGTGAQVRQLL